MTSPLQMTVYRPVRRLGLYVRAFQVFSAAGPDPVSVLDFGGCDVSVPVCFGHPVLVEDWDRAKVASAAVEGPRRHPAANPAPPVECRDAISLGSLAPCGRVVAACVIHSVYS
ncbi:MAG: hypothetical protein JO037_07340 [Actinobacteria bacterium]|nr:hypothetical protein [Actinomycetota bacterium]